VVLWLVVPLLVAAALAWHRVPVLPGVLAMLAGGLLTARGCVRALGLGSAVLRVGPETWEIGRDGCWEVASLQAGWVAFDRYAGLRLRTRRGACVTVYLGRGRRRTAAWRRLCVRLACG
jgi:hypothetical protein